MATLVCAFWLSSTDASSSDVGSTAIRPALQGHHFALIQSALVEANAHFSRSSCACFSKLVVRLMTDVPVAEAAYVCDQHSHEFCSYTQIVLTANVLVARWTAYSARLYRSMDFSWLTDAIASHRSFRYVTNCNAECNLCCMRTQQCQISK